jgi:hypothetical protein
MDSINIVIPANISKVEPGYHNVPITEVDNIIDASCLDIYVGNLIEHIPNLKSLDNIFKKIRIGGKIRILGLDLCAVATDVVYGALTPDDARLLIAGKYLYCIQEIVELCESKQLRVISKKFVDNTYIVEGVR